MTTYAGTGNFGYSGDGGLAIFAQLNEPHGVAVDGNDNVYIADTNNNRIRLVDTSGNINTFAGSSDPAGYTGDHGDATDAKLNLPYGVAIDVNNNVFIADTFNNVIRLVDINGIITTYAGKGTLGFSGDGKPATSAEMYYPEKVAIDSKGNIYISDVYNHRIRMVPLKSKPKPGPKAPKPKPVPKGKSSYSIPVPGNITTFAGTGTPGSTTAVGNYAIDAPLYYPTDVAVDKNNNVFILDAYNNRVRLVTKNGIISDYAGDGNQGDFGDGGNALHAQLNHPWGFALDGHRNIIYIADTNNNEIRKVFPV